MRVCPWCSTASPIRSRTRWFERPFRALTPARPYRCPACGRRYWARPSCAHTKGRTTVEPDSVVADRRGQEPGRRQVDTNRIRATDWFELQTAIDDEQPARGVTLKDVGTLSQAGIGEAVLSELIVMDNIAHPLTRFPLSARKLVELKRARVSDKVLLALLCRGRSADGDRFTAAQRHRQSEDESSDRLPYEDAHSVPAGRHAQRTGARASRAGPRN